MTTGTFASIIYHYILILSMQGLKPIVSTESPALVFGTTTKLASDLPATDSFLGKNQVPDLQKLFQVMTTLRVN